MPASPPAPAASWICATGGCILQPRARCILLALSLAFAPPALAQAKKGPKCPATFNEFLERFETDRAFHLANVRLPLPIAFVDDGVQIKDRLSRMQYTRPRQPWYPTPSLQAQWELRKVVRDLSATRKLVHFEQADAESYSVDFHFQKSAGCWRLVFMDDRSP